jgi:hypothetical protein
LTLKYTNNLWITEASMPFFYAIIFTEFLLAKLELIYYRNKNSKTTQLLDSK